MRSQLSGSLWQGQGPPSIALKLARHAGCAQVGLFKCAGPEVLLGALAASLTSPDIPLLGT